MKLLRINDAKGEYSSNGVDYKSIIEVSLDELKELIKAVFSSDCEIEKNEDNIPNPAEKIIYESIYSKLEKLIEDKESIITSVNEKFKAASEKYNIEV